MTVRISEIGPTENPSSWILNVTPRFWSFATVPSRSFTWKPIEIVFGGREDLGLRFRMQRDDRPRSFQFDPFVPISDRLTQPKVIPVELHGVFNVLHHQGHFAAVNTPLPARESIPANVNLSSPARRLPCGLGNLTGAWRKEGRRFHPAIPRADLCVTFSWKSAERRPRASRSASARGCPTPSTSRRSSGFPSSRGGTAVRTTCGGPPSSL